MDSAKILCVYELSGQTTHHTVSVTSHLSVQCASLQEASLAGLDSRSGCESFMEMLRQSRVMAESLERKLGNILLSSCVLSPNRRRSDPGDATVMELKVRRMLR